MLAKCTAATALKKRRYRFDIKRMSADCAANYLRLSRLLPGIGGSSEGWRAGDRRELHIRDAGIEASLVFKVLELCKYTTVLELVMSMQALSSASLPGVQPLRMQVRLYHDANLAEVVSVSNQRSALASYSYPNAGMFQPDEKAQQNHFLAEWLSKTLRHGSASESAWRGDPKKVLAP